ncbi:TonB-dependent receptor domain-containing protein [Shewanella sp. GXUN23E]|uniref:TonB-dependent receptor domain-containing protein n=1 Tax=Shewanella sp. GXUN23E TaxID=3422498 RepID=UPI003D7C85C9
MNYKHAITPFIISASLLNMTSAFSSQHKVVNSNQDKHYEEKKVTESNERKDAVDEVIEVVGSRLSGGDPSVKVTVITSEMIAAKGLLNAEDIIRSLPQNHATLSRNSSATPQINGIDELGLGVSSFGASAANLRGMGSANTLVLVNGRKPPSIPGQQDFVTNLNNIPSSMIERVEVITGGASAIYGSDAMAGVINIVLKKYIDDFSVRLRSSRSYTKKQKNTLDLNYGKSWDSTAFALGASYSKDTPNKVNKTGWYTKDYRQLYPNLSIAAARSLDFRKNYRSGLVYFAPTQSQGIIAPVGSNGSNLLPQQFLPTTSDDKIDILPVDIGGEWEEKSVFYRVSHDLTDSFEIFTEGYFTNNNAKTNTDPSINPGRFLVPASNAYNPFGRDVYVSYNPFSEQQLGLIKKPYQESTESSAYFVMGFDFEVLENLTWNTTYNISNSESDFTSFNMSPPKSSLNLPEEQLNRLNELLASSDPNIAINLFGDGSLQSEQISELFIPYIYVKNETKKESFESYIRYSITNPLSTSPIELVSGIQYNKAELINKFDYASSQKQFAYFAELNLPIIENKSFIKNLIIIASARYDKYNITGGEGVEFDDNGNWTSIVDKHAKFSHVTPAIGFSWQVNDELTLRYKRSGGFRAPSFTDLFTVNNIAPRISFIFDPLKMIDGQENPLVRGLVVQTSNPDLKPETSVEHAISLSYFPQWSKGLTIDVKYSDFTFSDKILWSFELQKLIPLDVYGNLEQFFIRDSEGNILQNNTMPVNIAKAKARDLEIEIAKRFEISSYALKLGAYYYTMLQNDNYYTDNSEGVSRLGLASGIDKYRIKLNAGLEGDTWSSYFFINYTPGYINDDDGLPSELDRDVDSYTTVDWSVAYSGFENTDIRLGVNDLLNEDKPFILNSYGQPFDLSRVNLNGRTVYLDIKKSF